MTIEITVPAGEAHEFSGLLSDIIKYGEDIPPLAKKYAGVILKEISNLTANSCEDCIFFGWSGRQRCCRKFNNSVHIANSGAYYERLPECIAKYSFAPDC